MIFKQTRVGQHGRLFTLYKLETMKDGWVTRPRLRRWGVDEIPQLWNVLRGEMAIFGPRPEIPEIHEQLAEAVGEELWNYRLRAKPGLLSLACVSIPETRSTDRYAPEVARAKANLDREMIDNMSPALKWRILRRLPSTLLRGQRC